MKAIIFQIVCARLLLPLLLMLPGALRAQATGEVSGRISNAATGDYLANARVSVADGASDALTDEAGRYRLAGLPAGKVQLVVTYAGLKPTSATVTLAPGEAKPQDFELALPGSDPVAAGPVQLEAVSVSARVLAGQALALNEQRYAPNIKTVVALDEFPNMGEGNVAEFMKHLPGVALDYNPQTPVAASIRGMPASGTVVTIDGMAQASSGAYGRGTDMSASASGNIERIEVNKVPTPDMPANAVGGSLNLITKSAFGRKSPLLTYSLFGTTTALDGIEAPWWDSSRVPRAGGGTASRAGPAFTLSYLNPLSDSLALSLSLSKSTRYSDWEFLRPAWNKVTLTQTNYSFTHAPVEEFNELGSASLEWRIGARSSVRAGFQHSSRSATLRQNSIIATPGVGAVESGGTTQGAATGVGNVAQGGGWSNQHRPLRLWSVAWKFEDGSWKLDAAGSYSAAGISLLDTQDGFFGNRGSNIVNLVVRNEGNDRSHERIVPAITAATRTGTPVALYDAADTTVNSATSSNRRIDQEVVRGALNVTRALDGRFKAALKAGAAVERLEHFDRSDPKTWTFTPPGGAAARLAGSYNLVDDAYASRTYFTDARGRDVRIRFISQTKLYELYTANPSWFVLNEPAAHTSEVNATKQLTETITAGYVRGDVRLVDKRLRLVGGVRYERTDDDGRGPRDDTGATYRRNPDGSLARAPNGAPIPLSTDALTVARLRYQRLGSRTEKSYDGFFPSFNSSFELTNRLVMRAAYARTIGRPDFAEIIPSVIAADPTAAEANRIVTVINTGLRPWMADNFDLTLEAYELKGAVASVSLFRKDVRDFFAQTRADATPELLAALGLPNEYLGYDIVTKRNSGEAVLDGVEVSYRQSLDAFFPWARGVQAYANFTAMDVNGANANDFTNFVPITFNFGARYAGRRLQIDLSATQFSERRILRAAATATVGPGSYTYNPSQSKVDASIEYRLHRRLSVFASARNLNATPLRRGTWAPETPGNARIDQYQYTGAMFTLGVKGSY